MSGAVEDVAGEADFPTLTQWLMANTKDKELTVLMAQLALARRWQHAGRLAQRVRRGGKRDVTDARVAGGDAEREVKLRQAAQRGDKDGGTIGERSGDELEPPLARRRAARRRRTGLWGRRGGGGGGRRRRRVRSVGRSRCAEYVDAA